MMQIRHRPTHVLAAETPGFSIRRKDLKLSAQKMLQPARMRRDILPVRVAHATAPAVFDIEDFTMRLITLCRALALPGVLALSATTVQAETISTNLIRNFDFAGSFALPIDTALTLDTADDARRLASDRLGTWLGTSTTIQYTHSYGISLLDPGVSTLPADYRLLFSAASTISFEGGALAPSPQSSVLDRTWICGAENLQCSSNMVSVSRNDSIISPALANPEAVLRGFTVRSSAQTDVLAEGAQLLDSEVRVQGSLTVHVRYEAKTAQAYVADALQATAVTPRPVDATRFADAATDIAGLRNASYTTLPVPLAERVVSNEALHRAHATLVVARESAALLHAAATGGTQFESRSGLLRQLWDLGAVAVPALGRSSAGFTADPVLPSVETELAALTAVMATTDDASFLAALTASPEALVSSADPVAVFSGMRFGMGDAEVRVYYIGSEDGSGQIALSLPAAERHLIYRDFFDRVTLSGGSPDGVRLVAPNGSDFLALPDEETYIGEGSGGVLALTAEGQALRIGLNNHYSPQFLVMASYGVAPVPEPTPLALMLAGFGLIALRVRRGGSASR